MAINEYDVGDVVRCSVAFANQAGTAVDPSVVTFKVKVPGSSTITYVYGTDAEVVKDSTGNYHVDVTATVEGRYDFRFAGSSTNVGAGERYFIVRESQFN